MTDKKEIVYVDMDDTICDFIGPFRRSKNTFKYPQSKIGFFLNLEPISGSIEGVKTLQSKYDVWILTRPSIKNTNCYTEKAEWIKKYLGEDMLEKLVICPDKSIVKGNYLIDDDIKNGQLDFEGVLLRFGSEKFKDWESILNYLM